MPLRAGAGLLACRGYCGCGRAADWGPAAYGSVYRCSGAPSWVPWPSPGGGGGGDGGSPSGPAGGVRGCRPPGWPLTVGGLGGGEGGRAEGRALPAFPLRPPGAALRWLRRRGLTVSGPGRQPLTGGGRSPLPLPFHRRGVRLSCGPSPLGHPLLSPLSPRRVAPAGGGGSRGLAGARGGAPGQRLVVSGARVSGLPASRASACSWFPPSPTPGAVRLLSLCERRGVGGRGALGWGARACQRGVPRRWSSPTPLCFSSRIGRGRPLRRRFCRGWGSGGGGFLRR